MDCAPEDVRPGYKPRPSEGEGTLPTTKRAALALVAAAACCAPGAARAGRYSVEARTEAQAYELRTWAGRAADDPDVLPRYRIVQYLDLGAFELAELGRGERLDFVASLRLDHDFGFSRADQDALDDAERPAIHLLYGYLSWSGAFQGLLDLKAGRQIVLDPLEFFSFDGADVHLHTPWHLGASAFGGLQVKATSLLGSPTFAPDGVRYTDARRVSLGATTDLLASPASGVAYDYLEGTSPLFGVRLHLEKLRDVSAMVVYRRSMSETTGENLDALPEEARGYQIDQEHLGAALHWQVVRRVGVYVSGDRDLYRQRMAAVRLGSRIEAIPYRLAFVVEANHTNPSFDADSIWNLFATGPRQDAELRAELSPPGAFRFYAGPVATRYFLALDEERPFAEDLEDPEGAELDPARTDLLLGGVAGMAVKPNRGFRLAVDAVYRGGPDGEPGELGYLGRELWLDLSGGVDVGAARHGLDARVSVAQVSDPYQAGLQDLWSLGLAAVGTFRLSEKVSLVVIGEENSNRYTESDLRAYAILDVRADFR